MDIDQVIKVLHIAMEDKRTGRRWVSQFIFSSMSSDALEYAVRNNLDPWASVYTKYSLDNPAVALLARGLLREYWDGRDGIEGSLTNVKKVYDRLARNPANREILKRPETVDWLNRAVTRAYDGIYTFTWES